ncbi:MAG: hypothetical protein ACRDWA_10375 [Acidimicrobiia bacterium]
MSRTTIVALLVVACGGAAAPSSDLPRTTEQNITVTMVEYRDARRRPDTLTVRAPREVH